jgi:group II intron reverse transcriptase/maturase
MRLIERVLDMDNLADAWLRVAENQGAPGVDGVSIRRFARNWEANLRRIRDQVQTNCYRPTRMRRRAVPKRRGEGQRLIAIPIVADRVLQRAVLNVVDDLFDRGFLDCSYGYRAGRGLRQAVGAVLRNRDRGLTHVLDADIDDCFASLDHNLLTSFLAETIDDPAVLGLMRAWLRAGRRHKNPDRGIALGSAVSPLCCNVYLHRLDWELVRNRWAITRYADDFCVFCAGQKQAQHARQVVTAVLAELHLQLEPTKTRITSFDEGFEFLGVRFYRDTYAFTWEGKVIEVEGPVPSWIWGYMPEGYE